MSRAAQKPELVSSVPIITCPMCGTRLRLATVEPLIPDDAPRMTFDCDCGFEYRLSATAAVERL